MALTLADRGQKLKSYFYTFVEHFLYSDLCNYKDCCKHPRLSQQINANTNSSVLISYLEANRAISKLPSELGIGPIRSW